jgi:hypothetical protein
MPVLATEDRPERRARLDGNRPAKDLPFPCIDTSVSKKLNWEA